MNASASTTSSTSTINDEKSRSLSPMNKSTLGRNNRVVRRASGTSTTITERGRDRTRRAFGRNLSNYSLSRSRSRSCNKHKKRVRNERKVWESERLGWGAYRSTKNVLKNTLKNTKKHHHVASPLVLSTSSSHGSNRSVIIDDIADTSEEDELETSLSRPPSVKDLDAEYDDCFWTSRGAFCIYVVIVLSVLFQQLWLLPYCISVILVRQLWSIFLKWLAFLANDEDTQDGFEFLQKIGKMLMHEVRKFVRGDIYSQALVGYLFFVEDESNQPTITSTFVRRRMKHHNQSTISNMGDLCKIFDDIKDCKGSKGH